MKLNNKPIGVFDSGLGGLTCVKELSKILPGESIVYFGDTGRVPYGDKSKDTIIKYALQDISFLLSKGVKMIIAACGTVSSVALDIGNKISIPFTGVVRPTAISAVKASKNGRIGIIGTSATIRSLSYRTEIHNICEDILVFEQDCPLFVPLVENGYISPDDPILKLSVERYLSNLVDKNIDTLILGCTHYPIISKAISNFMGNNVTIIDSGRQTALYAKSLLLSHDLISFEKSPCNNSFYVSDNIDNFSKVAELFLGKRIDKKVKLINIENF